MKRVLLAITLVMMPSLATAQVTVGTANQANCWPMGCGFHSRYQQSYGATAFGGPLSIQSFSFFHTFYQPGTGTLTPGTYQFSFATTSYGSYMSMNFDENVGSPLQPFATIVIGANTSAAAPIFTVYGASPFYYDPAHGNLLLDVSISDIGPQDPHSYSFFDFDEDNPLLGRNYGDDVGVYRDELDRGQGLVTRFDAVTTTPEPASLILLATGLAGFGIVGQRRRVLHSR